MSWQGAEISWILRLAQGDGDELKASDMEYFKMQKADGRLVCRWKGHPRLGPKFTVSVRWWTGDKLLRGNIGWTGGSDAFPILEALFPVVEIPMPKDEGGDISFFTGYGGQGALLKHVNDSALRPEGLSLRAEVHALQFDALISPSGSLYFDQRDTEFHCKGIELRTLDGHRALRYSGVHFLPLDGKTCVRYRIPYAASLARFEGGWFEAAQIYKSWARRQWWARRPPVDPRLRNIGMWVWNRGLAEDVISPVETLQEESGVPVALDWYWWHRHGYDTNYPEYWPPREGLPVFRKALSRLKKRKIFTQVYTNGLAWDMDAEHWTEGGENSAVRNLDGTVKAVMFNSFAKRRLAWMCGGGSKAFRNRMAATVRKLRQAGLPGIYMDMIGCASMIPCHCRRHSHAPGGGNYQAMGYRELFKSIRKENPGMPICTEEGSEAFMDLCDSAITLSNCFERLGGDPALCEHVPAFNAVYHGIAALFGSYALPDSIPPFDPKWPKIAAWKHEKPWHLLYPDQFFFELARGVTWGLQPTVANLRRRHLSDPEFCEVRKFLTATARFYHANREFLFDGDMLSPGTMKVKEIDVELLARMIFTAEGCQKVFRRRLPALLHSLWKAPDGRIGLVVANYSGERQNFIFESEHLKASGEVPSHSWLLVERSS